MNVNKQLKKQLFGLIKDTARNKNMSQRDMSKVFGVSQARVSNLMYEREDLFSIDKLLEFSVMLGYDIEIKATMKDKVS